MKEFILVNNSYKFHTDFYMSDRLMNTQLPHLDPMNPSDDFKRTLNGLGRNSGAGHKQKIKPQVLGLVVGLVLMVGLASAMVLSSQEQDVRRQAMEVADSIDNTNAPIRLVLQLSKDKNNKVSVLKVNAIKSNLPVAELSTINSDNTMAAKAVDTNFETNKVRLNSQSFYTNESLETSYTTKEVIYTPGKPTTIINELTNETITIDQATIDQALTQTNTVAAPITKNVRVISFDPILPNHGNKRLSEYMGYNGVNVLSNNYKSSLYNLSSGVVNYVIVDTTILDEIPRKLDGYQYAREELVNCLNNSGPCYANDPLDYSKIFSDLNLCSQVNSGAVDELWLFGSGFMGFWETAMGGPGALTINGPPFNAPGCNKRVIVMGFNYSRELSQMLHSMGHRTEDSMGYLYSINSWESTFGDPPQNQGNSLYEKYHKRGFDGSYSGCGNTHGFINTESYSFTGVYLYDYSNTRSHSSTCNDWINFPNVETQSPINCSAWNCGEYSFQQYRLQRLPKYTGALNGINSNWWQYILNPDQISPQAVTNKDITATSINSNMTQSSHCALWVATCNDMHNFSETDCSTQKLFNRVWGDGLSRWKFEACQNHGGVWGGGTPPPSGGTCDNNVPVGGTACQTQGDNKQYRCTSPNPNQVWTPENCTLGNTCQGTACTNNAVTCNTQGFQSRFRIKYLNGSDLGWLSSGSYLYGSPPNMFEQFQHAVFVNQDVNQRWQGEVVLTVNGIEHTYQNGEPRTVVEPWTYGTFKIAPKINGQKCSNHEATITITSPITPTPIPLPSPEQFRVVFNPSNNTSTLSWTNQPGATNYRVESCTGVGCTNFSQVATPATSPHTISVPAGQVQRYRVRAFNGSLGAFTPIIDSKVTWAVNAQAVCANGYQNYPTGSYYLSSRVVASSPYFESNGAGQRSQTRTVVSTDSNDYGYVKMNYFGDKLLPYGNTPASGITYGTFYNDPMIQLERHLGTHPVSGGNYSVLFKLPDDLCQSVPTRQTFVTSSYYTGNLEGLTGADSKCQQQASSAGLSGVYKAWLSTNTSSAKDRIPNARFVLVSGEVVAESMQDLTKGYLSSPINRDQYGNLVSSFVFTGTFANGLKTSSNLQSNYCNNWTSASSSLKTQVYGYTLKSTAEWTQRPGGTCNQSYRLYCFRVL